jgi:hypothetical protein
MHGDRLGAEFGCGSFRHCHAFHRYRRQPGKRAGFPAAHQLRVTDVDAAASLRFHAGLTILSILMDGVASADAFICQQLLGSRFKRLQVPLAAAVPLDDYQDVPQLVSAASDYMKTSCWSDAESWVRATFV